MAAYGTGRAGRAPARGGECRPRGRGRARGPPVLHDRPAARRGPLLGPGCGRPPRRGGRGRPGERAGTPRRSRGRRSRAPGATWRRRGHHPVERPLPGRRRPRRGRARHGQHRRPQALGTQRRTGTPAHRPRLRVPPRRRARGRRGGCRRWRRARRAPVGRHGRPHRQQRRRAVRAARLCAARRRLHHGERWQGRAHRRRGCRPGLGRRAGRGRCLHERRPALHLRRARLRARLRGGRGARRARAQGRGPRRRRPR